MAFNKRTWKGRQGTGLNKFSINGASPVTVVNQPDSITEQGDALSAGNLNDLEDRIYTAFEDEATARANADSNLLSAIDNNSQRIENLEVAVSGSLVQTNTDATMANTKTITNANEILPWAILKRVGARAVAFNQLLNTIEVVTTSTTQLYTWADIIPNHVYLVVTQPNIASWQTWETDTRTNNWTIPGAGNNTGTMGPTGTALIIKPTTYKYFCLRNAYNTISVSGNVDWKPMLIDLTAMSEYDSTLTNAQNIAKFRAKYPASYYPYNTGEIIPLNPSAFKVVGFNKWDGTAEDGRAMGANGNTYGDADCFATGYIEVRAGESYYINSTKGKKWVDFYDADKKFIVQYSADGNNQITVPSGAFFGRWSGFLASKSTFCVNLYIASLNGQHKAYKETTIDTSFTSDYKYVNPSCHDYSENVLVNGVMRREEHIVCGTVDLSQKSYSTDAYGHPYTFISDIQKPADNWIAIPILHPKYHSVPYGIYVSSTDVTACSVDTSGYIHFVDSNPTGILNYKKATPTTSLHNDPIPNFPSEDGTTITAITPQTELVNAIDVPSTIAYMTKNAS